MLANVTSCALQGLDAVIVAVEVDASRGMPGLTVVGLPDAAVKESRERVRSAIKNFGLIFPGKRITVNLAPADIRAEPTVMIIRSGSQRQVPPTVNWWTPLGSAMGAGQLPSSEITSVRQSICLLKS